MEYEAYPQYSHVDQDLVDKIVCKLKAQGIFDQFRKDCLADVDTKPAYQNLQQRVNGTVANFLANHKWRHDLNKNQLRENLRRHVQQDFLEVGVSRIVEQVVNPKICPVFLPQVEDVVYDCLGIEKPKPKKPLPGLHLSQSRLQPVKRSCSPLSLLPHDLDPVSPESDHNLNDDSLHDNNGNKDESRNSLLAGNISNDDSHLSGISELTSHGSIKDVSEVACMSEKSNILADRTNHEISDSSPSHKNLSGCENIRSDFDNFSNLQEKLKKTDHLNGSIVKKETGVYENSAQKVEDVCSIKEESIENSENEPVLLKSFNSDNSVSKPDKEETVYDSYEQRSSSYIPPNFKIEDLKNDGKIADSPTKNNNGLTFHTENHSFHNEISTDVICKNERPDDSLSNITKYSEDSRSSDSVVKEKIARSKHSELKHNSSKREYKKSETSEKHRHVKEDSSKQYKFESQAKHKNETDSEYNSSDKDQKSDHNSSDKESLKKHIDNKNSYSTTDFKNVDNEITKETPISASSSSSIKEINKSIECNPRNDSSGKSDRKSSSSSHRSSSRDKKHDSSRDYKSREHRHDREKDGSKHRSSSDKRDDSKDKKYKDKSQEIKRHDSREERDKQRSKKDKTEEKESKSNNSEVSSNRSKENKLKDEQKHISDKEKHKSYKDESKDKKEKSHDKKDHYKHKEDGDKRDKDKYKDEKFKDDKQRSSKDHKSKHDKNVADKSIETKKTTESKLDEKRVTEDKTHHKRNSDLSKRSSSSSEKVGDRSEKEDRIKEKDRTSKKRKGERCKEEVKHKEARRSTDRDSNGRGSSGIINKGTQQNQKDNQYISSNNTQSFENSTNERNSCSDSVEVPANSENEASFSKPENSFCDNQNETNDIDLILQKINSSIQEVQGEGEGCDEPDSSDVLHTDTQPEDPNSETSAAIEIKKPKIAKNIFEIRKIMQARKNIDKKRRKDIIKRGFMRKLARDNSESEEFSKQVCEHSETDRTSVKVATKNQSLNTAFVNENVDSNNFVEKRDYDVVLRNDVETDCLDASCKEDESSDDELFKGFTEIDLNMAMQKLSKAICYRTQSLVKISPLKLDEEFFYNGKLLKATVDFPAPKKMDTCINSKRKTNKKGVLLDNNLNNVNARDINNKESVSNNFDVNVPSQHSVSFDDSEVKKSESNEGNSIKANSDFKNNCISSHVYSSDSTDDNISENQKTKNGCVVVVHLTDVLETDKLQSSQDESCSSNLPVIISPDHCYDSDVNYDENYGLNESFSSDFGGSKPLSVSLTETMLENLMKESNLISDYTKNNDVSSSDEGWNGYTKINSVQNDSSQLTVNISESSSYLSGQNPHEPDAITSTDAKRKGSSFDTPEPKKSR